MNPNLVVIDNFFENPDEVRNFGLRLPFDFIAHYPGMRTRGLPEDKSLELKLKFESLLGKKISRWDTFDGDNKKHMNTCFQLCLKDDTTWVHHDYTSWAAIVYLTPDADPDSGTGLFNHKETKVSAWIKDDPTTEYNNTPDMYDLSKWELSVEVKNKYNRMIMYKANQYHRSMIPGFGNNYVSGRLTQVFFFDIDE